MKLDDFFRSVYKALERAFPLDDIELVKDYPNQRLILTSTNIDETDSVLDEEESPSTEYIERRENGELRGSVTDEIGKSAVKEEDVMDKIIFDDELDTIKRDEDDRLSLGSFGDCRMKIERNDALASTLPAIEWEDVRQPGQNNSNRSDALRGNSSGNLERRVVEGLPKAQRKRDDCRRKTEPNSSTGLIQKTIATRTESDIAASGSFPPDLGTLGRSDDAFDQEERSEVSRSPRQILDSPSSNVPKPKRKKPDKPRYACNYCSKRYEEKEMRRCHVLAEHSSDKPFHCTLCNYKGKTKILLKKHMMDHTGARPFKCGSCDYESKNAHGLRVHELKHSGEKSFACNYCSYRSNYRDSVKDHEKAVHRNPGVLFRCELCSFQTLREDKRAAHVEAHEKNQFYECNVCTKKIYDYSDFRRHFKTHTAEGPRKKNILCPECGEKFYTNERLKCHMYQHTGKKEYKCRLCASEYCAFLSLLKHFRKHHPNDKVFHCESCDFYSNNLRESNQHSKTLNHMEKISSQPSE